MSRARGVADSPVILVDDVGEVVVLTRVGVAVRGE